MNNYVCGESIMNLRPGDRIIMKKNHPCGSNSFLLTRVGMDFKLVCEGCGRELMLPRAKVEAAIKRVISAMEETE